MQTGLTSFKASNDDQKRTLYVKKKSQILSKAKDSSQMTLECPTIFNLNYNWLEIVQFSSQNAHY